MKHGTKQLEHSTIVSSLGFLQRRIE